MSSIFHSLVQVYGVIALLPIIPFVLVVVTSVAIHGDRKRAIRLAMDVTTAFLLGCVAAMLNGRLGIGLSLYFIVLVMLIAGGLLGNAQNREKGKVDATKIVKVIWRLSFFILTILYVLLTPLELIWPTLTK
ncbi:MAG: DUF3397 domain-containing protein [Candidatus Cohnella colombiensis]|uniref:DUF3397 domain-containing protein n=1 Tax=Candidatus Cohnella colombiensis TaxID=3121368 RepID=A0AA95ETZ7_9BACL|nr:MAG: DUF3397 domain-containing protein [Cohnella sp.]